MLVITRRPQEGFVIKVDGRVIHVKLIEIMSRTQIKIGINAEPDVLILRDELVEKSRD